MANNKWGELRKDLVGRTHLIVNPTAILELLDERDAQDKEIANLQSSLSDYEGSYEEVQRLESQLSAARELAKSKIIGDSSDNFWCDWCDSEHCQLGSGHRLIDGKPCPVGVVLGGRG